MPDVAVDGLKFKLEPEKLKAGDPQVLLPSLTVFCDGKGVMAGPITVIYPAVNDSGYVPMPVIFKINPTGSRCKVGGQPVVLAGDYGETVVSFPPAGNYGPDVVKAKCTVEDAGQSSVAYIS
jgi:hypothetical protein